MADKRCVNLGKDKCLLPGALAYIIEMSQGTMFIQVGQGVRTSSRGTKGSFHVTSAKNLPMSLPLVTICGDIRRGQ